MLWRVIALISGVLASSSVYIESIRKVREINLLIVCNKISYLRQLLDINVFGDLNNLRAF